MFSISYGLAIHVPKPWWLLLGFNSSLPQLVWDLKALLLLLYILKQDLYNSNQQFANKKIPLISTYPTAQADQAECNLDNWHESSKLQIKRHAALLKCWGDHEGIHPVEIIHKQVKSMFHTISHKLIQIRMVQFWNNQHQFSKVIRRLEWYQSIV